MELTTEDKQRIRTEGRHNTNDHYQSKLSAEIANDAYYKGFKAGAEYATIYERKQQAKCKCNGTGRKMYPNTATFRSRPGIIVGHAFTEDVCNLCWGSGDLSNPNENPLFNDLNKAQKERYEARKQLKELEAEHTELIRRIKSILKASTVHDKISILEELEQLLNSLKTK